MTLNASGNLGIGTTSPAWLVDVLGSDGNIRSADNASNSTNKFGRYILRHYTNAEEDAFIVGGRTTSTTNEVFIGGGSSVLNQATQIQFFTAANNTTLGSTERMRIDSSGNLLVGTTTAPATPAKINISGGIQFASRVASSATDIHVGGSGRTFTITGGGNGNIAYLTFEAMNANGSIRNTYFIYNGGGNWTVQGPLTQSVGTAPTVTVSGSGTGTVTINVKGAGANPSYFNGGFIKYEFSPSYVTFA
jgi:hypothetical protein